MKSLKEYIVEASYKNVDNDVKADIKQLTKYLADINNWGKVNNEYKTRWVNIHLNTYIDKNDGRLHLSKLPRLCETEIFGDGDNRRLDYIDFGIDTHARGDVRISAMVAYTEKVGGNPIIVKMKLPDEKFASVKAAITKGVLPLVNDLDEFIQLLKNSITK